MFDKSIESFGELNENIDAQDPLQIYKARTYEIIDI